MTTKARELWQHLARTCPRCNGGGEVRGRVCPVCLGCGKATSLGDFLNARIMEQEEMTHSYDITAIKPGRRSMHVTRAGYKAATKHADDLCELGFDVTVSKDDVVVYKKLSALKIIGDRK